MIMKAQGIWQPTPQRVPPAFAAWLKQEYGSSLTLAWSRKTYRWAVFADNPRTRRRTFVTMLEDEHGGFVPLNDGAKRIIKRTVVHSSQVQRDDGQVARQARDADEKHEREYAESVRDILRDPVNARRISGNSSRKGAGATARKALEDARKKRGG